MESPRKFNDCYFYYYSTCTKGDNCVFRHEPSALGCETMCTAWQQGKCLDKRCKLRHMELRKNRKQIPCYWENQPGGCRKIHCPFMHKNPEARTDGIAPIQPIPMPIPGIPINEQVGSAEPPMAAVPASAPVPAPVPLLWQQQRQDHLPPVVLDSTMLGVLPASSELRRMLTPHAHAHAHAHAHPHDPTPNPYAPMPVDPLVVNFEEESDNESAPSSTPTKYEDGSKSQELLLLEKIQAESAAYYNYDTLPTELAKERKLVRTNLTTKYDRVSLDEIAGKKQTQEQRNLDFKVLSLDEIRARKSKSDSIIAMPPITINLRKRKLSTQETVTSSGNKILKVVRSNSIVYKKLDQTTPATSVLAKVHKQSDSETRKRTFSEQSDVCELQEDELEDNCNEFKRIKVNEQGTQNKPRLIRNRNTSENKDTDDSILTETIICNADNDSDNEVQIVSVDISNDLSLDKIYDSDIEIEPNKPIEIVDLSDDDEDNSDITAVDLDLNLVKNVPDVVASCQRNSNKDGKVDDRNIISEIDDILNDDL